MHQEISELKTQLSMLVLERDNLVLVECRNIETAYMLKIGALEYQIHKLSCDIMRLRRKSEMIQISINRQEKIDEQAIESQLDNEFAAYKKQLDEQIARMNAALQMNNGNY